MGSTAVAEQDRVLLLSAGHRGKHVPSQQCKIRTTTPRAFWRRDGKISWCSLESDGENIAIRGQIQLQWGWVPHSLQLPPLARYLWSPGICAIYMARYNLPSSQSVCACRWWLWGKLVPSHLPVTLSDTRGTHPGSTHSYCILHFWRGFIFCIRKWNGTNSQANKKEPEISIRKQIIRTKGGKKYMEDDCSVKCQSCCFQCLFWCLGTSSSWGKIKGPQIDEWIIKFYGASIRSLFFGLHFSDIILISSIMIVVPRGSIISFHQGWLLY